MEINVLKEKISLAISSQQISTIKNLLLEHHTVDFAKAIFDLKNENLKYLLEVMNVNEIALIAQKSNEAFRKKIFELLDHKRAIEVISNLPTDIIADILGTLNVHHRKKLLGCMLQNDSKEVELLLGFKPDSAGGIMTTRYISLKSNLSMTSALEKIKSIAPKTELIETIFITDLENRLIGIVDLRDILISSESTTLIDIMNKNVIFVYPDTDQEEVSLLVSKYDLNAIPVINNENVILGIITTDDIIDVIVQEQTEDLLMLSGVNKNERVGSNISLSISRRLPWLLVNLLTSFMAAYTVGMFEDVIIQISALAVIMPIIVGMGGNGGAQTLSIVIRSLALGEITLKKDWKYVFREISIGFINGSITGAFASVIIYIKYNNLFLCLVLLTAMICNLVIGSFFGFTIPLILKKLKLDPAVSSSIFLTTATDVGGFFIFLSLAKHFISYLL